MILTMAYLYSVAKLFLIKRIDDRKYIPMISERKSTTLLEDPLPTWETAKKNCTEAMSDHHHVSKVFIKQSKFKINISHSTLTAFGIHQKNLTIVLGKKDLADHKVSSSFTTVQILKKQYYMDHTTENKGSDIMYLH